MARRSSGGGFRSTPRRRTPAPAKPAAAPGPAPHSNGGLMGGGSFASNVFDGLTWGAGSSIGRRLVDFFAGPRTIRVAEAPSQAPAPVSDACDIHNMAFADCIKQNASDISQCQFYIDMLNQCSRDSSGGGIPATTTFA
ncbi:uncharacterized protein LOC124655808 [Lolium rigidum]|uniref:uncharacterized protein LOC124655808 n=1 Tax=Lolium rigidum TaxID=89674 RepID=UPI001F5CCB05|nr:uncharacterized protein LOC124655808 [Lolium rigidum]